MVKRYNEPISLEFARPKCPEAFVWRGQRYRIDQIIRRWTVTGEWWQKNTQSRFHAVIAASRRGQSGQYEIFYERKQGRWFLGRIYD